MLDEIHTDATTRMDKTVESTRADMLKIRTGRANTALVEHITVDYYGNETPITQVANVSVADSRTLSIQPWEKTMIAVVEKAIMESDLGLNPVTAGEVIRVPLPPLTEERRKEMTKIVRSEGENGKVAVRNIRRDAITKAKDLQKNKEISVDEEKDLGSRIQKATDEHVAEIDKIVAAKEAEIMEV